MKARWNIYKELWTTREPKRMLAEIFSAALEGGGPWIVLLHPKVSKARWIMGGAGCRKLFSTFAAAKRAAEKLTGAEVKR